LSANCFRPCILIPTYNNPKTLRGVVEKAYRHLPHVIVIDDGSGSEARQIAEQLERDNLARVVRFAINRGKGAAVKTGFLLAQKLGYTHALQVDADGQHELDDIPLFLESSRKWPDSLIVGQPVFDASAPKSRLFGRTISNFWVRVETGGEFRNDTLCGFRIYPLDPASKVRCSSDRMDFDVEILVRLIWHGVQTQLISTRIRYFDEASGAVSHFHSVRDNVRITWLHTRLVFEALLP
jgi:glycosyltransferase involved in cell wall biosynthesis